MKRKKHVQTPDNWYPTAVDGTVLVSIHRDPGQGARCWRVSVWGDDDFGMDRGDLDITSAFSLFRGIKDGVTKAGLAAAGFRTS